MQQVMFRIKDPKKSLDFYTEILGMKLLKEFHFESMKFSLYFVGYAIKENIPEDPTAQLAWFNI